MLNEIKQWAKENKYAAAGVVIVACACAWAILSLIF